MHSVQIPSRRRRMRGVVTRHDQGRDVELQQVIRLRSRRGIAVEQAEIHIGDGPDIVDPV